MPLREPATVSLGMVSVYLVPAGDGCALIDAGVAGQEGKILAAMSGLGLAPESLRLILITHAHGDHIGTLQAMVQRTHAPVLVHRSEAPALVSGRALSPHGLSPFGKVVAATAGRFMSRSALAPSPADVLVDDELSLAAYGIRGRALHTPGHTAGSISLLLDDGGAFVGDLSASGGMAGGRSHLPPFGDDRGVIYASWRRLLEAGAKRIYPGHGAPFLAADLETELDRNGRTT